MAKTIKKVTVMGGGNGGFAVSADLTLRGFEVTLYESPAFAASIAKIKDDHTIHLDDTFCPEHSGTAVLANVTTDLDEALAEADIILPVSPAYSQEAVAKSLVPHLKEGMVICLTPGSCGGGLVYAKIFHDAGVLDKVKICEMSTLPYATRKVNDNTVRILLEVPKIYFAAFPAKYNQEMFDLVSQLYPAIVMFKDVLETALNNGNIDSHPTPVVLNAGKIEYYKKHWHYKEGITPSVAKVNYAVNKERQEICKAFGYEPIDIMQRLVETGYCKPADTLYDMYRTSEGIFMDISGPDDLSGRYLTEDAPCSLVFCANLAKQVGVPTPLMDSVANLASALRSENYWETGRTLDKVGLDGKSVEEIKEFLQEGYK
ncbi:MAG: NAD/NADP octopine/nopaline dehydrogenase family protein [Firmicutes bacterium]|nr:NAD/NADP octopine/nopaline dehydrogenase family protein [Bacillota bacterium]